jgi:hypothetical protein
MRRLDPYPFVVKATPGRCEGDQAAAVQAAGGARGQEMRWQERDAISGRSSEASDPANLSTGSRADSMGNWPCNRKWQTGQSCPDP